MLTKRSNFAADLDVWRNANRDLYFAARAVKHLRLEMAQLQRQYPGVQWGFFCTGVTPEPPLHSQSPVRLNSQTRFCTHTPVGAPHLCSLTVALPLSATFSLGTYGKLQRACCGNVFEAHLIGVISYVSIVHTVLVGYPPVYSAPLQDWVSM